MRGMRFRLAASYVIVFAALLSIIGILFRQNLKREVESDARVTVTADWEAAKLYIDLSFEERSQLSPEQRDQMIQRDRQRS